MLKEFTIKNFTSFKDETLFSMEADYERVSEHQDHIVSINGNKLLKVVSMYGPNGGGKSNVLTALRLAKMVQTNNGFSERYEYPCIFNESDTIEETIFFVDEKYEMGYRFCIVPKVDEYEEIEGRMQNKPAYRSQTFEIVSEEVSYRKFDNNEYTLLFSRDKSGLVESNYFGDITNKNEIRLAKGKSVIRYLFDTFANTDSELTEDLDVIKHLFQQIGKINRLESRNMIMFSGGIVSQFVIEHNEELTDLLNEFDVNIKGIKVYEKSPYPFYFVREIESDGKKIERELSIIMESDGTQKIFWMLLSVLENIKNGKIFYCDDMNAYLHPKMFRAVIKMFQENNTGSQLIFNSHDIINMDNSLFRRDEIWFAYKDENLSTQLIPLSNIVNYKGEQVRKDAKFYKQYLEGKYGADPFIKRGLNWDV